MSEKPKAKGLVAKLAEVMGAVGFVAKRGRNEFHKYDYATEADISGAVRDHMAERSLMLIPSVEKTEWRKIPGKNGEQSICTLTVRFSVMDGESGEKLEFVALGEGQDSGDKATYKAMTGALKYALLKLFMISTGDDPEGDEGTDEHNATPPQTGTRTAQVKAALTRRDPTPSPPEPPPPGDMDAPSGRSPPRYPGAPAPTISWGKNAGQTPAELNDRDLKYHANKLAQNIAEKPQFRDKDQPMLDAIQAEIRRRATRA